MTVAYRPALGVTEILPLLEAVLGLPLLPPTHFQPARRARRYLLLASSVHLTPDVSMIGQKSLLVIGQILPNYAIRTDNPNECKRTGN
jgi:hypothetical protein